MLLDSNKNYNKNAAHQIKLFQILRAAHFRIYKESGAPYHNATFTALTLIPSVPLP
jgi:hypothetical protein